MAARFAAGRGSRFALALRSYFFALSHERSLIVGAERAIQAMHSHPPAGELVNRLHEWIVGCHLVGLAGRHFSSPCVFGLAVSVAACGIMVALSAGASILGTRTGAVDFWRSISISNTRLVMPQRLSDLDVISGIVGRQNITQR